MSDQSHVVAETDVDAMVLGGGPAGCAAAIGLARAGARVLLHERATAPPFKPGEIIEPTLRHTLAELGLLDRFEALGFLMLAGSVSIWDDDAPSEFAGAMSPHGHGVLIERQAFERWLIGEARAAGVTVLQGAANLRAAPLRTGWEVRWNSGDDHMQRVGTPVVIEATGRAKGLVAFRQRRHEDRLVALLAYVTADAESLDQSLLIEAAEDGWWYAARLPEDRAVVAFMTDADQLPATMAGRSALFSARLAATRFVRLHARHLEPNVPLRGFPASSSLRQVLCGSNWVAIGEAAATYDPLSGRGVAAALAKGAAIARLIARSSDLTRAITTYAHTERATFADYLIGQRSTYARAARNRRSTFWSRRCA